MRNHLKQRHNEEYDRVVAVMKLKHSNEADLPTPAASSSSSTRPFKLNEWIWLMIRWIVIDDQVHFMYISEYIELTLYLY